MLCQPQKNQEPSHTNEGSFHVESSAIANIVSQVNQFHRGRRASRSQGWVLLNLQPCKRLIGSLGRKVEHRTIWLLFMYSKTLERRQQIQNGVTYAPPHDSKPRLNTSPVSTRQEYNL